MIVELLIILGGAVVLDLALGDPPSRYHPTAWVGRLISALKPKLKSSNERRERINGTVAVLAIVTMLVFSSLFFLYFIDTVFGAAAYIIVSVIILKTTFAIKGMENHARSVMDAIAKNDIINARVRLASIVGRDTSYLDEQQVLSATIESVGESTVDGITSPLFYFSIFGIPGALACRAVNTLDSMLGYKDSYHKNIGWFTVHLDTIANFIPARITALLMVIAARMIKADWRNSFYTLSRDRYKTPSLNGGWAMAPIAGALRVRLEKVGYYFLGEPYERLTLAHCESAISIMKITTMLFCTLIALPAIIFGSIW